MGPDIPPPVVPEEVDRSIRVIRGQKVLLDGQLASFYGVETRVLLQAVKRHRERFPEDFLFQRDRAVEDQFRQAFSLLERLFNPPAEPRKRIGFHSRSPS